MPQINTIYSNKKLSLFSKVLFLFVSFLFIAMTPSFFQTLKCHVEVIASPTPIW